MGDVGITSIQTFSVLLTGHPFLHYCLHLLGLHFSLLTMAILCFASYIMSGEKLNISLSI